MIKYTIAEFRKNTREALDSVDRGATVEIERYGKMYTIVSGGKPDAAVQNIVTTPHVPNGVTVLNKAQLEAITSNQTIYESHSAGPEPCPHGYPKGFCKKADCNRKHKK